MTKLTVLINEEMYYETSEGEFSFEGYIDIDREFEVDLSAAEIADQLTESERDELVQALTGDVVTPFIAGLGVDELYEGLTEMQKAVLFNKFLKHGDYNSAGTSIVRLQQATQACISRQDKEAV